MNLMLLASTGKVSVEKINFNYSQKYNHEHSHLITILCAYIGYELAITNLVPANTNAIIVYLNFPLFVNRLT